MIRQAILRWARARKPDFVIGGAESPYLRRHWLLPRNRFFNVYVHEFLRSDDDRALHDHPWLFNVSWRMDGGYIEHTISEGGVEVATMCPVRSWTFRWGPAPHRVELLGLDLPNAGLRPFPCWTLFITGPVVRTWGFHCRRRWVPWQQFTDSRDRGAIGRGCD